MLTISERVVAAIKATKLSHPAYWESCLLQRAGYATKSRLGSWYPMMSARAIEGALLNCEWFALIGHPDVAEPASAFVTSDLGGMVGVVRVTEAHLMKDGKSALWLDDQKGTGFLSLMTDIGEAHETERTVLIIGPDDAAGEMVWTFHPGPPAPKPTLAVDASKGLVHGKAVSVAKAQALGFAWAKLR